MFKLMYKTPYKKSVWVLSLDEKEYETFEEAISDALLRMAKQMKVFGECNAYKVVVQVGEKVRDYNPYL